jgi:hypothetical protein
MSSGTYSENGSPADYLIKNQRDRILNLESERDKLKYILNEIESLTVKDVPDEIKIHYIKKKIKALKNDY